MKIASDKRRSGGGGGGGGGGGAGGCGRPCPGFRSAVLIQSALLAALVASSQVLLLFARAGCHDADKKERILRRMSEPDNYGHGLGANATLPDASAAASSASSGPDLRASVSSYVGIVAGAPAASSDAPEAPAASAESVKEPSASFVCVTGQLERLELKNKVRTLLDPVKSQLGGGGAGGDHAVDVALVLTENRAIFTRASVSDQRRAHRPAFANYADAVGYLTSRGFNVVTSGPEEHASDPTVYPEYLKRLAQLSSNRQLKNPEHFAYDRRRAQNHLRQALSKERCLRQMLGTGRDYTGGMVVHWRDDVGFENELPVARFRDWLRDPPKLYPREAKHDLGAGMWGYGDRRRRPVIVTSFCRNWFGINDRGAFVSPGDGAYAYFTAPMAAFLSSRPLPSELVCNHERFLRHLYGEVEGFRFVPTRDLHPMAMYMNNGTGVFREEEVRDVQCKHWWPSYRRGCTRANETIELL